MFRGLVATARKRKETALPQAKAFLSRLAATLGQPLPFHILFRRPGAREMMNLCHQFATLLNAGITVLTSLEMLEQQADNLRLKHGLRDVYNRVEHGQSLAEALSHEGKIFSPFFVGMIYAGETGGVLDETLQRLAQYYEKKNDLERKIKGATAYPKFVLLVILGVVVFLLTFVLPSFAGTFALMGMEAPLPTRLLIAIGEGIRSYWQLLLAAGAAAYLAFNALLKTSKLGYFADYLRLRMPVFGILQRKLMVARFCHTLGTLLGSGVGLLTALDLAKNVVANRVYAKRIGEMNSSIMRGMSVAATLSAASIFPLFVTGMVNVGEQSGKLEEMLGWAADLYELEVNYVVDRLGSLLEPALVILLALVVGGIVLSVFLPLFGVFDLYL